MGHPLDPLSVREIQKAAEACKKYYAAKFKDCPPLVFNVISLDEPSKSVLLPYENDGASAPPRKAFCILQLPRAALKPNEESYVVEAIVNLGQSPADVEQWKQVTGVQPLLSPDDCFAAERIVKADAKVCAMLQSTYGIKDVEADVACDPWSVHEHGDLKGRLVQTFLYKRSSPNDNQYAHPISMTPVVCLEQQAVIHIDASPEPQPINEVDNNYHRDLVEGGFRDPPTPLNIVQPEGPSFTVEGNLVKWQKWSLRVGFNYREGLVLHQVGYEDKGRVRPILHRGSMVEMAVPYAEPRAPYHRKCAFDVGDYGMGFCTTSLALGCDCLGHIHYFDAVLNDNKGEPLIIKKAICMHEEDHGLLWKHVDYRNGHSESRRSRRLVLSFLTTVVNYEYLHFWYFYQDGTIEYEVKLTGELSTNALSPGETSPEYGTFVDPGVNAQHHQHMFCSRLDLAVDDSEGGKYLEVVEQEVEAVAQGPNNPYGNAFRVKETVLEDEASAQRVANATTNRAWVIKNPRSLSRFGYPVAFKLIGSDGPLLLANPNGLIARKGAFSNKNLWVTPYAAEEKWPAGDYPCQSNGGKGLPEWTKKNRSVKEADCVLWHAFGLTHVVRVEDFPVMPVEHVGFKLKPVGFFDRNPSTDLPPECNKASVEASAKAAAVSCCGKKAAAAVATNGTTSPQEVTNGSN